MIRTDCLAYSGSRGHDCVSSEGKGVIRKLEPPVEQAWLSPPGFGWFVSGKHWIVRLPLPVIHEDQPVQWCYQVAAVYKKSGESLAVTQSDQHHMIALVFHRPLGSVG